MFAVLVSRRGLPTTQAPGMLTWSDLIWREMFGGMASRLSCTYMNHPAWSCLRLFRQATDGPRALALPNADKSKPARIAMIAMTTKSSISVKAAGLTARSVIPRKANIELSSNKGPASIARLQQFVNPAAGG